MERPAGSIVCLLVSVIYALLTDMAAGERCWKAVTRQKRTQANLSQSATFQAGRRSWDWDDFECENGCCGETGHQYCCPDGDDDENESRAGLVTGLSVSIFIVILTVVVVVVGCMCYRARQKRSQSRPCRRSRPPTVSTTLSSATLPPSYEMSTMRPDAPPRHPAPMDAESPPPYEEVMADNGPRPSAPPPWISSTPPQASPKPR